MAHNDEFDIHHTDFDELMDEYVIPAKPFPLEAWTTDDLVKLSLLIDAELQQRAADANDESIAEWYGDDLGEFPDNE